MIASQIDISKAKSINGWMTDEELFWLAKTASKCKKIVEFGSFQGKSTRAMADNILPNGAIWAVDPWNGDYYHEDGSVLQDINTFVLPQFVSNLKEHIRVGTVIPCRNFSYNFDLPILVDMVFIDGDHRYKTVIKDIEKGLSLLKPGGIISGHDYDHPIWPGVKKAVDNVFGKIELEGTIWWTLKY